MWLHRHLFIIVTCLTFLVLAIAVFLMPQRVAIRSAIEIGSAVINGKQESFELPEHVARGIATIYGPAALVAMAAKGASPLILRELQNPNAESIGRPVVMLTIINPDMENEAKEFQETTAAFLMKEHAPRAHAARSGRAALQYPGENDLSLQPGFTGTAPLADRA
jgi:hypothetical protein